MFDFFAKVHVLGKYLKVVDTKVLFWGVGWYPIRIDLANVFRQA